MVFHPVDTVAKRLMTNKTSIFVKGDTKASISNLNKVIFKDKFNASTIKKYRSLFPGLGFAAGYKILQRIYKFGGQPVVKDFMQKCMGSNKNRTIIDACAGSLIGMGEVFLLPLDILKIKSQTAPETLAGRGVIDLFMKEGKNLYLGWGWTLCRNAPGSFALFGGNAVVRNKLFKIPEGSKTSLFQYFCASTVGSICSITVAAPLDVVKTRIQNRPFDSPETGMQVIRNLVKNEGLTAFFKGLTPKILFAGPKLIFSFTIAQYLIDRLAVFM